MELTLKESNSISQLTECLFVTSTGLQNHMPCSVLPGNIIRIGNIAASSPSTAWIIQFRARVTSTTFVFAFSMNYRWFTTVWNSFAVWTFGSNPTISFGYSSFT